MTANFADDATDRPRRHRLHVPHDIGRLVIPAFLVAEFVVFALLKPHSYATVDNVRAVLANQAVVVILALAAMVPLIVGEFDISVASVLALCAVLVIGLQAKENLNPVVAILVTEVIAIGIGAFNGLVVVRFQVSSFVATLGTSTVLSGIWLWYLNNNVIVAALPASFTSIGRGRVAGIPYSVIYAAVIAVLLWLALNLLPVGRRMYAVGANRRSAFLSGVSTDRLVLGGFVTSAALAGIGGIVLGAQLGSASGGTGTELLLPAFAGAFLGATTIRPGRFNVIGTVIAVYTLAFMIAGLEQVGASTWVTPVFNGAALIVAVSLSRWAAQLKVARQRRRELTRLQAAAVTQEEKRTEAAQAPADTTAPTVSDQS